MLIRTAAPPGGGEQLDLTHQPGGIGAEAEGGDAGVVAGDPGAVLRAGPGPLHQAEHARARAAGASQARAVTCAVQRSAIHEKRVQVTIWSHGSPVTSI